MAEEKKQPKKDGEQKAAGRVIVFTVKDRETAEQAALALRQKRLVRQDVQIRHVGELVEVRVHTRDALADAVMREIETFTQGKKD